jgi:hypothetical protein
VNNLNKIKSRIRKLLALSKSPNPNEAAVALETAQRLMAEYNVKRGDVGESGITEEDVKGGGGEKPPHYEAFLMGAIAGAFGCKCAYGPKISEKVNLYGYRDYVLRYVFVGPEHRVKIASYLAVVLSRKLRKARSEYVKTLYRVRLREKKIKRADDFCLGWVTVVVSKLHKFAFAAGEEEAIDLYTAGLGWKKSLETIIRGKANEIGARDFENGNRAGAGVEIRHGVDGKEEGARLLEES